MEEMSSSLSNKPGVQTTGYIHCCYADQHRPLKLVWPREYDCRDVC